jgi:hypothetical protein
MKSDQVPLNLVFSLSDDRKASAAPDVHDDDALLRARTFLLRMVL